MKVNTISWWLATGLSSCTVNAMLANRGDVTLEVTAQRGKKELFRTLRRQIRDDKVLRTMEGVPRDEFVPQELRHLAYEDIPLAIDESQTISQPYIVALMTSLLALRGDERVLEVGTGSGYQAAILSRMVPTDSARDRLMRLGYHNLGVDLACKALGAPHRAPFDAIIVTAGSPNLPAELAAQLKVGGRMVIPVGSLAEQELALILRTGEGVTVRLMGKCRFVPLIGDGAWPPGSMLD